MHSQALDPAVVPELGRYHLVAELARGGMGVIHLAVAHGLGGFNKLLVVKELKPELSQDETYVAMFLDEARLAARLTHRNIVQTMEVGSEGSRHFMVMELLEGRSLHRIGRRLSEPGRFPVGGQLRVIAEALLGLHYAHELRDFDGEPLGVVHRDISPLNVFVTFDGQAKLLDFGIAKSTDSSQDTKTGILKGRVAYMAPEQAWGSRVDRRADIYAAGVMVWEAAAGQRLWPGMSDVEILARILREGPPRLCAVRPDASLELDAICARAMAKEPEARYPTAADLLDDLEAHLGRRDDRMSMREVGALVGKAFAEERRKMSAVIEETLARVRNGPRSGVMPAFEIRVAGTPSGAHAVCDDPSRHSARLALTPAPPSQATATSTRAAATGVTEPDAGQWWRSRGVAIPATAAAVVLLLAVGIALAAAVHDVVDRPTTAPLAASQAAPPTAGARDIPELVDVVVRVTPPSAQITIDGAPVPSNPFHARYGKDGQVHHVMAFADGYDAKLEDVSFAGDVSIDVSLDRRTPTPQPRYVAAAPPTRAPKHAAGQAAAPPAAEQSPPQSPPARPDVGPAGGHAPLRPIMTSNPYGTP